MGRNVVLRTALEFTFMRLLGEHMRARREELGLAHEIVAAMMGTSRSLIVHFEKGDSTISGPKMLLAAEVLQMRWVDVLKLWETAKRIHSNDDL